jgi:hypothetical protein
MFKNACKRPFALLSRMPAVQCILFAAILTVVGCGASLAPVTGKVTYKGEPVKGGTLLFAPAAGGIPASATVQEDGTYKLKVGTSDGAVIGKNLVSYTAPPGKPSEDPRKEGEKSPYANMIPMGKEIEIKSGKNVIDIMLEPGPPPKKVF